jgi:hypothetical protein
MSARYFTGLASHLGQVHELPHQTFAELVEATVAKPVQLALTRPEMFALPDKEQNERKKTDYLVPAVFKSSPSARQTGQATHCNVLFIDVDDAAESARILNVGPETLLGDLSAVVWHTARSTPENPRLRVMVPVNGVPVAHYPAAVTALAGLLGMNAVTSESKVAVQPMYLPVQYTDSPESPIAYQKTDGQEFDHHQIAQIAALKGVDPVDPSDADIGDIANLREPVDSITSADVEDALKHIDPSCSMKQWVEIGMGLKHQLGDAGFEIWDSWSSQSSDKYSDTETLLARWESFKANPGDRVPVTVRSIIREAVKGGWDNRPVTNRIFQETREWIQNPARSSEELLDQGAKRIAKLADVVGPIEQKVLVADLFAATKARGLRGPTVGDLSKEIKRLTNAAVKANAVQPPWTSGIVFLTAPNLFYRYLDNRKMRREVIDLIYQSPTPDISASQYLIHEANIPVVENVRYEPSESKRVFVSGGVPYINTYRPSYAKADKSQALEAGDLLCIHACNLHGSQYWVTAMDWAAYMVKHPGQKIRWAPTIQSFPGGGKGLWAFALSLALGQSNTQWLAAEHIMEGTSNGWASGSQLLILDEVRVVGTNRHRIMDKMKPLISDDKVSVRQLYEPVQTVPNVTNYILFTNHHDALAVHDDDRRYWVIFSPLQSKADIDAIGGEAYFNHMYSEFKRLAGGIRAFLEAWPISKDFNPQGRAPVTPFLKDLAKQTTSPLASAVADALQDEPHALVRKDLVSLTALRAVLPTDRLPPFSDQALGAILRTMGLFAAGRHLVDGTRHALWAKNITPDIEARAQARMDVL